MCRSIKTLHDFEPRATDDEIRAASLQFVRKLSGSTRPSKANEPAFTLAVEQVARAVHELLDSLVTNASPKNRDAVCQSQDENRTPFAPAGGERRDLIVGRGARERGGTDDAPRHRLLDSPLPALFAWSALLIVGGCATAPALTSPPASRACLSRASVRPTSSDRTGVSDAPRGLRRRGGYSLRFPSGTTILDGRGQYRKTGRGAIVREPSKAMLDRGEGRGADAPKSRGGCRSLEAPSSDQQSVGMILRRPASCSSLAPPCGKKRLRAGRQVLGLPILRWPAQPATRQPRSQIVRSVSAPRGTFMKTSPACRSRPCCA